MGRDLGKILNADLRGKGAMKFIPTKSISGKILYLSQKEIFDFNEEIFGGEPESNLEFIDFFLYSGKKY